MNTIYYNGHFTNAADAIILASDRGFLLGDGLFETIRAYEGQCLFLKQHWQRLSEAVKILRLEVPGYDEIEHIISQLLKDNQLEDKNARVRVTLSRRGNSSSLAIISPSKTELLITAMAYQTPAAVNHLIVSRIRRNELSPLSRIKSLNYLDNILALQEAYDNDADEALLCNTHENLACATAANVFLITENTIYTPRLEDGALPGIMRQIIMRLAVSLKIKIIETALPSQQLAAADEIFLSNSLFGVREVKNFQGKFLDNSMFSQINHELQKYIQHQLLEAK